MFEPHAPSPTAAPRRGRLYKALVWLCTIVFILQMAGTFATHAHDAGDDMADCVSCQIASNLAVALPGTPPAILAVFLVLAYLIALQSSYVSVIARRYLTPPRQAPPVSPSL